MLGWTNEMAAASAGEDTMSDMANKAIVRRYYDEALNQGNLAALDELASTDYVEHNPLPGQGEGLSGLRDRVGMLCAAFRPRFTLEDLIAEGDRVAVRWINHGVHQGPFAGMPATGCSFAIAGIDIHVVRDGKLAEHWDVVDQLSLLQQIGVLPGPNGPSA
jgi:steroid delta-isomerase-like uncharacterized protein